MTSRCSRRVFLASLLGTVGAALAGEHPELDVVDALMTQFLADTHVPGAAVAMTKDSRLVYARGFGLADRERAQLVQPDSLFRIASVSKPITAVAVLQLVERNKLALDAHVRDVLTLPKPSDSRWKQVTILHLLQHTGGWDRGVSTDPMFQSALVVRELGVSPPAGPQHIIRYMLTQPLDFTPGARYAYSNFGYCLLGRVIERVSGEAYEPYVRAQVLAPLGIRRVRLGKTLLSERAAEEVRYYDARGRTAPAVMGAISKQVPLSYGAWSLEAMDSHGGWLASAVDLVRFAAAFDVPAACKVLRPRTIEAMLARPDGAAGYEARGKPRSTYYGCGWRVRQVGLPDRSIIWHTGSLIGTSSLLVRRYDGKNWAILFNSRDAPDGRRLSDKIDDRVHTAVDQVKRWPESDQFARWL